MTARPLGAAVLIEGGPSLRAALVACLASQRAHRSNGMAPAPQLTELETALRTALSAHGTTEVRKPQQVPQLVEPIDTKEAANIMQCSTRNVVRLALQLGGQRRAGRWIFDRAAILDHMKDNHAC